ncbi:anaphase-promoting complex subunit 5-domain-containing protein [Rhypophila decipiens]|uniref:Anaphase-promoting complex subunit 5 n=1 Tax=Rhypophila decipiens TaxID=261697 RepID=A0AAN7B5P2_9PEZI|nr:anaphase-promoting complex subunit 5-domain-containing protein [Rhypophila decipiens]
MSRYLTPAKIGLLALIELYIQQSVPNDAIIPIINFISSHLLDCDLTHNSQTQADRWKKAERIISLVVSIRDFEQVLDPFAAVDRLPGRRLWDRFLETLWGIDSLHALQEFFDRLPSLLARTKEELRQLAENGVEPPSGPLLSRNSPFGVFVRRSIIEFARLQFHHTTELWKAFVKYRQPTAGHWRRRNPQHGRLSFDSVLMTGEHEWGENTDEIAVVAYGNMLLQGDYDTALPVSTDDIESLLEFQIQQIQNYGNRIPPDIKAKFERLLKDSRVIPSLSHYLNYSDAWKSGDYPTSFDYLHQYFDYTMQNRDRLFYQYALMNLAIVQSDFGCHKEAIATMLETVATARENKDMTCLNFALNWLFQFGRAHPELTRELEHNNMLGAGKESLSFLRVKAKESGMWYLWSAALQSEAKMSLATGDSISTALEHMVRSSQLVVERNLKTMLGSQMSLSISLWDRLGISFMSAMTSEVFLRCHAQHGQFEDELKIKCRLASLLAGRGKYEEAFEKLESTDQNYLRSAKADQYWHVYRGLLKLRRDLHRDNLQAAESLLSQLLQTGANDLEPDLVFIIDTLHIEYLIRRGEFDEAFSKIERLITELRDDNRDLALRIRLLLLKAHLFDVVGRPEKGFTIVMRATSLARRARLLSLLWQGIGALANILNSLGEFAAAAQMVTVVLPRCLETDTAYQAGTLYNLLADSRMGQAGEIVTAEGGYGQHGRFGGTSQGNKRATEFFTKADNALEDALRYFSMVEDVKKQCEVLAKKATLKRAMGDYVMAENCAARYLALKNGQTSATVGRAV